MKALERIENFQNSFYEQVLRDSQCRLHKGFVENWPKFAKSKAEVSVKNPSDMRVSRFFCFVVCTQNDI